MFSRCGSLSVLVIVSLGSLVGGCDSDERRPKGPNPYRRDVRPANPSAGDRSQTNLAESRLDRLAGATAAATSAPASAPATAPVQSRWLPANTIGPSVMFVNKEVVTIEDVLMPVRPELERAVVALPPRQYVTKAAQLIRKEMDKQVFFTVVYQEAKKSISEDEDKQYVKAADADIQQIVNLQFGGLHAKFEKHLADRGMTIADLREKTKRRFVVLKFLSDRFRPLAEHPKRDELKKYYDEHQAEFVTQPRARMSLIEVSFDAAIAKPRTAVTAADRAASKEAGRKKIERARQELESGVPFAAVAKKYSDGIGASQGGAWDEIGPDSLRPRYKVVCDALFRMSQGQVSDMLEGTDAFFIVQCDGIRPGRRESFEETQRRIVERMLEEKYGQMQDKYVRDLMVKAVLQNETEFFQAVLAAIPQPTDQPPPNTDR